MVATHYIIAEEISRVFKSVDSLLREDDGPRSLLRLLGWELPADVNDIGLSNLNFTDLLEKLGTLDLSLSAGDNSIQITGNYASLFDSLSATIKNLDIVVQGFRAPGNYLAESDIPNQFRTRLFDFIMVELLSPPDKTFLLVASIFAGIVELRHFSADAHIHQIEHIRRIVHWNNIPKLFNAPKDIIKNIYGWNQPGFDSTLLVTMLGSLLSGFKVKSLVQGLSRRLEFALTGADAPSADTDPMTQLLLYLVKDFGVDAVKAGLSIAALRPTVPNGNNAGFAIMPFVQGTRDLKFDLSERLTFSIDTKLDVQDGIAFVIRAGSNPSLKTNLRFHKPLQDLREGYMVFKLNYRDDNGKPTSILSVSDGFGLEAKELAVSGGLGNSGGILSPIVLAELTGGRFFIDPSQMDSFLKDIIPVPIEVNFDFGIGWSSSYGFFFKGSASPAIAIGLHKALGPFAIDTLHAALGLGNSNKLPLELSVSGKGRLGPFKVSVDRIGLNVAVTFGKGNLGSYDLNLSFKPPNGLGLELDAGLISGGGYLAIDSENHRYAGILDCSIADVVQVKIIGILDTVLPGGTPGFSLLLVITTEFPPMQLGFGFTLNGVGGIGAVNRSMAQDALRAGFQAHRLDSVLFPNDPVNNAPQIISDLSSFFPPANGRYVFGPLFLLGWGSPTLITFKVGAILEIPDPVRLVILGQVKMVLPSEDFALVELNIDILGEIDFEAKLLTIQGSMYDSHVVVYSISGDMGLMLAWGDNPNFACSVGGLNPRFQPPPNFPQLKRCCVSISNGDNPRLSTTSYFAVTSNSVQFGANVDLYAAEGDFSVHGWVGFDALFIFSPFSFTIDFSAGLDVEYDGDSLCSIHVNGMLSGPRPWHVVGHASFHILLLEVSASIDLSWGDSYPVTLPTQDVLPLLTNALGDAQNWSTIMPSDATPAVSFRARQPGDMSLIVHPMGVLQVRQKVVPFEQTITKFGNARPSDGNYFTISSVTIGEKVEIRQWLTDQFAIGQYTDLTDDQKLTAQSYQPMNSGISIGSSDVTTSREVQSIVAYRDGYIYKDDTVMHVTGVYVMPKDIHLAYSRMGDGFVSASRTIGVRQFIPPGTISMVTMSDVSYVIASTEDLSMRSDILNAPVTQYEAQVKLSTYLAANPTERGAIQVTAVHEVQQS